MMNEISTGQQQRINTKDFANRLSHYGFEECAVLQRLLILECNEHPGLSEIFYIWTLLRKCLEQHDDGSAWFNDLRDMEATARSELQSLGGRFCPT
ncbi:hypothetical protein SAMN05216516_102184 [Izhakiella capsodis]|uniref:Uncharacterized protein n=1 Tax=Izhakiella capsodis TaxID=1367852 RepID=A0A1I4W089_9GAMM|nr:hypothetical protein [Izhakiella capsodis]SFN06707.1 hypothetical protein SAMN05216516_102184 [Izhakiella capsodis]